jgi:hypothetical protein
VYERLRIDGLDESGYFLYNFAAYQVQGVDVRTMDVGGDETKWRYGPKPPTTAVTVILHWWGYEVYIPSACMNRIDQAQRSANAVIAFLQALSAVVVVLQPFVGILAAYVSMEYSVIKEQDQGKGVVIAAAWPLPVLYFPRAWDVPDI